MHKYQHVSTNKDMMYQHALIVPSPLLVSQDPGSFTKSLRSPTADLTEDQAGLVTGSNKDEIFG